MPSDHLPARGTTANQQSNPRGVYNPILKLTPGKDTRTTNALIPGRESEPKVMGGKPAPSKAKR